MLPPFNGRDQAAAVTAAEACTALERQLFGFYHYRSYLVALRFLTDEVTMSLDKNLFTLVITPDANDPAVVDLVDPSGVVHYSKRRVPGPVYKAEVYGES
jgi:hypothetical protein